VCDNIGDYYSLARYGAPIQASLGLSAGAYGSLYSAAILCSSFMIMFFGGVIDRQPLRRFATCVALGLLIGCLVMSSAHNVWLLAAGFFLVRLFGQGLLPHTAQTTMARWFDNARGKALSISASGVPVGEIMLPLLAVTVIAWLGWHTSWLVWAATVPLIYLPLIFWLLRRSPIEFDPPQLAQPNAVNRSAVNHNAVNQSAAKPSGGRREMLADSRFWLALPAVLAPPFLVTGVFIQQGFILQQKAWNPLWLANCFIAFGIAHWLSSLTAGMLVDQFSARRLLPLLMLPLAVAM